ncbi:MAG: tRNA1(Val) (adenine(37)-N6)-methyltransferase [Thermodesulfobacteriota bacterium]
MGLGTDETLDFWGEKGIRLIQKKNGYRFSIDALILSHFVHSKTPSSILDLGTGSGILTLLLARNFPGARFVALELEASLADLARRNVLLNGYEKRIFVIRGDLCRLPWYLKKGCFDLVISNPPFRPLHKGRINPDPQKALARHEIRVTLPELLMAVAHALKAGGKWFVIYPAWRLVSLLASSRKYLLEPKKIQLVHSFAEKEAEWVLMEAVYQGREDLRVLPPLTVYREVGVYNPQFKRWLDG